MTSPGGPGYPGGSGGSWSGDDPGFGVPQQPQPQPPPYQPQPQPPPYQQPEPQQPPYRQPQAPPQHQQPLPGPGGPGGPGATGGGAHAGAHGRAPAATPQGPRWGRIGLVAGGAIVVIVAVVLAAMWIFGGSSGGVDATRTFFKAVKDQNTQAAASVTCSQAPTLAEQFGKAIKGVEGTLGTLDKIDVSAPETSTTAPVTQPQGDPAQKRDTAEFNLVFVNGSVHGRATLVNEDDKWKVCFVDLDPPKTN